ncbi:MAG: hypothetical protein LBT38_05465 [Deltaproteobacteria bacterium]|jgi:hypothetical protein|nr:hypothetical protein [Deltaproteobacteria bacterium]
MSSPSAWVDIILNSPSPEDAWRGIFERLETLVKTNISPVELHNQTVAPDRLLAEAAWDLWQAYPQDAPRTAPLLKQWCSTSPNDGRAILILDALSLREMPFLINGAQKRNIQIVSARVTGSEAPSNTDDFAHALGLPSRACLAGNNAPSGFNLFSSKAYTTVITLPFEDALGDIPPEANIFAWHSWLDDLIHLHKKKPEQIHKAASATLQGDGFWKFVDRLRQGRKLVITSDHGYAVSKLFSSEESDPDVINRLREVFGASRHKKATDPWRERFMPPIALTHNENHIVMGQKKWKAPGGFPDICHGGLSLLEVATPFIELPPK